MPQFLYAPGVRVYIDTEKYGIVDVSDDLVDGTLTRRSDGVSSFSFSIQNARRKYDAVFTPMDRIVVRMKRLEWVQVFTGYLNQVPLQTAWPRVVNLTASCSLKRLQYWYWDSYSVASQMMVSQALIDARSQSGVSDGGMTNVALTILKKVVGWPESKVHIARIPDNWYKVVEKLAKQVNAAIDQADTEARQIADSIGVGSSSIGGTAGLGGVSNVLKGSYGGETYSDQGLRNAETIYNAGKKHGADNNTITAALMAAMQESTLGTDPSSQTPNAYGNVGIFQMRPGSYWGTFAQVTDVAWAAERWFTEWDNVVGPSLATSLSLGDQAEKIEQSGLGGSLYGKHQTAAAAMVSAMVAAKPTSGSSLDSRPMGATSGLVLAQTGIDLCNNHPDIPYRMAEITESQLLQDPPPYLDCSSFVQAVYLRALGSLYNLPRTAAEQYRWCRDNGKAVSVDTALRTAGALVFKGPSTEGEAIHHVEMSLGDGKSTIGAHSSTSRPHQVGANPPSDPSYWDYGGFLPRISYSTDAGGLVLSGTGDGNGGPTKPQLTTGDQIPGYNPNDPFDKMFGDNAWLPVMSASDDPNMALSQELVGIRTLLNDQPLLPYLKNLFGSTMRSFCSAPNGDLVAWYPDYYGMWGTAAKMVIQPIEMRDFSVYWSDDFLVTHQFAVASTLPGNLFNVADGTVSSQGFTSSLAAFTTGVVNIDIPAVWSALFGLDLTDAEAKKLSSWIKQRFGARPDYQELPALVGPKAQFFAAIYLFLRQFAYQYSASVPLTFMPEIWPGMLLQIPDFNFQAYVTTVTHTFQFGDGGSFTTDVTIAAPARLQNKSGSKVLGLPIAGGASQ